MLWLALHLPQLAIDLVAHGERIDAAPIAVVEGPLQRRVVHAVNAVAAAAGVHAGQKQSAAQALCADLVIRARSIEHEAEALQRLAACLYRVSAEVSVHPPQGVLVEVAASRKLFGGGAGVLDAVRGVLAELELVAALGIAPTPSGAELAARLGDGTHVLSRQALLRMIERTPLALSPLSAASIALLAGSGLQQLGEVLRLPRDALARRIGRDDMNRLDRLRGALADRRALYQPPRRFERRMEMPAPLGNVQSLLFPLRRMLRDLGLFLLMQDAGVQSFEIVFKHEDHADSVLPIGLLHIERDHEALFELMRERLDRIALPGPTVELTLRAQRLHGYAPAQQDLLSELVDSKDTPERLLERLRARLGDDAVHGIVTHPEHRPEFASRPAAVALSTNAAGDRRGDTDPDSATANARPHWLLATPQPIDAGTLQLLRGPERIESGWWDGDDCRRDYFVAEDAQGRRVWVYRALNGSLGWYLHGVFG
jgi:protein ImuB